MSDMRNAYKMAACAVRQRLAEQHPDALTVLDSIASEEIAVYKGQYDSVEEVLDCLKVPYHMAGTTILSRKGDKARVHFGNCTAASSPQRNERLRAAVEDGAWLVTSDWSLQSIVQTTFPNTIQQRKGKSTGDEVVAVEPGLDSCWSDVVVLGVDPQWWLEGGSYPIEILDPAKVRIEAASHEMLKKYESPVVAAEFDWGAGRVFHVISHFWLKRSRTPDARYAGPAEDFLRRGMRLSDDGIARVLREIGKDAEKVNFAMTQSAATATELVTQLCIRARCAASA
jgi:hypothetical protein